MELKLKEFASLVVSMWHSLKAEGKGGRGATPLDQVALLLVAILSVAPLFWLHALKTLLSLKFAALNQGNKFAIIDVVFDGTFLICGLLLWATQVVANAEYTIYKKLCILAAIFLAPLTVAYVSMALVKTLP